MRQPHLHIDQNSISPYVLLPGDPARVDIIGLKLEKFVIVAQNREFRIGVGIYKDKKITVCSTGIGGPSTAIAVEELIRAGATQLIRVGTCGGAWRSDIPVGSLVIPSACVRDEGTTTEYIPKEFPAVSDIETVFSLKRSADLRGVRNMIGINRTHDAFYANGESIHRWGAYLKEPEWNHTETPILSSDMETSILFIIASLRGVRAGAVLAVNSVPESLRERITGAYIPTKTEVSHDRSKRIIEQMIEVALDSF